MRKTEIIGIRVTKEEKMWLLEKAKEKGLTLSEYLRLKILN